MEMVLATDWWSVSGTWAAALAALVSCVIAVWLVFETRSMRLQATQPWIAVFARHHEGVPQILELVVKNTGVSTAYDIRFSTSVPVTIDEWGRGVFPKSTAEDKVPKVLRNGIQTMAPGEERAFFWGAHPGIMAATDGHATTISAYYRRFNEAEDQVSVHVLDPSSFKQVAIGRNDPLTRIAKALEAMSRVSANV